MIHVVSFFNGLEVRVVGRVRTTNGANRQLRSAACGDGWGVKLRGTKSELADIGAFETPSGWYFDCTISRDPCRFACVVAS